MRGPTQRFPSRSERDQIPSVCRTPLITLQRHLSVLTKSTHVESRFCGRSRQVKAAFCTPVNPCVRSVCSRSVVVGLKGNNSIEHRMFCHITAHWHGRPLVSHEVIVTLSANTTTHAGLTIQAA